MKETISFPGELEVRQDPWGESPCSRCSEIHCCRNLPLASLRLKNHGDFINLLLTSTYNGLFPALKKTGEWSFHLKRDCQYLDKTKGQCKIHKASHQSMICKSYDAHTCWYVEAFNPEKFSTSIRFNTEMLIWYEKRYNLIGNRFDVDINWEELCTEAWEYQLNKIDIDQETYIPYESHKLSFKNSRLEQFLFLPPYERPKYVNHFELLSFRLSFPGIYLAIADSCWAFMVKTDINRKLLNSIRNNYPTIEHKDGIFSFDSVLGAHSPFSEAGEQWIILQRSDLEILKNLTTFDTVGRVKKLPTSSEILHAIKPKSPDITTY